MRHNKTVGKTDKAHTKLQTHAIAFIALFWFCFLCVKLKCYCVFNASRIIEVALRKYTNYPVGRIIAFNMHI